MHSINIYCVIECNKYYKIPKIMLTCSLGVGVALKQALTPEFKAYQENVVANSRCMSEELKKKGYTIVSGLF